MASIRKMWSCKNTHCKNESGKHRGYKKVCTGEKQATCKHCGEPMVLSDSYTTRIIRDGKSYSKTMIGSKKDATEYVASLVVARKNGALFPGEERLISWEEGEKIFDEDMVDRLSRGKSSATVTYYRSCVKTLTLYFGKKKLQHIEAHDVERFRQERARDVGNSIVNGNLAILKIFYKLVCKRYRIRQYPKLHEAYQDIFAVERLSKPPRREVILTDDEIETFLNYCKNPTLYHFVFGTLNTGLRHGDMVKLRVQEIDFERMEIKTRVKGGKNVVIPLTGQYGAYLRDWLKNIKIRDLKCQFLFPNPRKPGESLTVTSLFDWDGTCKRVAEHYRVMKNKESADKFESLVPHHLRHTFATHYLYKTSVDRGMTVAVFQLSMILGHSTEHITKTYLHSMSDQDRAAMDSFGNQMFGNISVSSVSIR